MLISFFLLNKNWRQQRRRKYRQSSRFFDFRFFLCKDFIKSDVFILVIPYYVDKSYLQSGDGSSQVSATINAPENNYARYAAYALVNGKLHIFGGWSDETKVFKFLSANSKNYKIVNRNFKSKKSKNKINY